MKKPAGIIFTETPRDALQALQKLIPSEVKAKYINALIKVGFDTLDVGSFVSPKAVPQMADTAKVVSMLETGNSDTKLMVLVGNLRGGEMAASESKINTIAYPHSVSGTFLHLNLNTTREASWKTILELKNLCDRSEKELRVYITMAFGNPYGDRWNDEIVIHEVEKLFAKGIKNFVFSDITGEGTPGSIGRLCDSLVTQFPDLQLGIHLHTKVDDLLQKLDAAWNAGIRSFESAMGGYGGCPMTGYELLGNVNTISLLNWCDNKQISTGINHDALLEAQKIMTEIFI
jgi:hydroxymethylglutaryl-CoA lyase